MREDFSRLRIPDEFVALYPPERDALFDLTRALTTDKMLGAISECDYGNDASRHRAALEQIRAGVGLDQPIGWIPNEVLYLFQWSESKDERHLRNPAEFHIARAFACSALLRLEDVHENRSLFNNDTLAPLIESCSFFGKPFRQRLLGYLSWSLQTMEPWDEDYLFHAFGFLTVFAQSDGADSEAIGRLGTWLMAANLEILSQHAASGHPNARTFMDLPYVCTFPKRWRSLAVSLRDRIPSDGEFRQFVDLIATPSARGWLPRWLGWGGA